ncbi:hypothetical protein K469DRAFT_697561 [Zopfia rhizophila CBS 207.26]|uniref:Uncharacterized protein n=1 Tax=Zopfia rhizophila CBS 207.26 TaxID=1314779 RepID=A0A6A6DEX3_9PEZI|nr:hypothetical protein K469DRAFT_697561 [Zopfia rhizophila CBS 207.26]
MVRTETSAEQQEETMKVQEETKHAKFLKDVTGEPYGQLELSAKESKLNRSVTHSSSEGIRQTHLLQFVRVHAAVEFHYPHREVRILSYPRHVDDQLEDRSSRSPLRESTLHVEQRTSLQTERREEQSDSSDSENTNSLGNNSIEISIEMAQHSSKSHRDAKECSVDKCLTLSTEACKEGQGHYLTDHRFELNYPTVRISEYTVLTNPGQVCPVVQTGQQNYHQLLTRIRDQLHDQVLESQGQSNPHYAATLENELRTISRIE